MRILALQLKRIGDVVLTTGALRALRAAFPEAHLALAVCEGCASLLGAIEGVDTFLVFGRGRGWAPWQQALGGHFDACLDFTGTDRSALIAALSRAPDRRAFAWLRQRKIRALAFPHFVASSVRERHTADHYLDLAQSIFPASFSVGESAPALRIPPVTQTAAAALLQTRGITRPFAILHPGTARQEKFWLAERWQEMAADLRLRHGFDLVLTGGRDPAELAQVAAIEATRSQSVRSLSPDRAPGPPAGTIANLAGQTDLLMLAALVERAALVVSCDTAIVHLAAAFRRPQLALFGPTNPFHWRPRHELARVISAAQPDAALTTFTPRMKGAPMDRISTAAVIRVIDALLAATSSFSSSS